MGGLANSDVRAEVTGISWRRFYLQLDVEVSGTWEAPAFYLVTNDSRAQVAYVLDVVGRSTGEGAGTASAAGAGADTGAASAADAGAVDTFHLEANITNNGFCECLAYGSYRLVIAESAESAELAGRGMRWCEVLLGARGAADALANCKAFPFGILGLSYVVYFDVALAGSRRVFVLNAALSRMSVEEHRRAGLVQLAAPSAPARATWANRVVNMGKSLFKEEYRVLHRLFGLKRGAPRVMFASQVSNEVRPNMARVLDRISERGLDGTLDVRVSCAKARSGLRGLVDDAVLVRRLAWADIIVLDDYAPAFNWLVPASDVSVIQLWHSGAGFKSVGYARWGLADAPAPDSAYRRYTYAVSSSRVVSGYLAEAFGVNVEQVIPLGMPRMDGMLDEARLDGLRERLYEQLPQCRGKEVVLFAPTYRGSSRSSAHYPYDALDFEALYESCADERVIIFKMHPWVADAVPIPPALADRLIDAGQSGDVNDLFAITDVLVTDYSSCIYEFSRFGKPMLFFAFDEEEYAAERGFHRDYRAGLPGKLCTTTSELTSALAERDYEFEKVAPYVAQHFDDLGDLDSGPHGATDRVIDWLLLSNLPDRYASALEQHYHALEEAFALTFRHA